MQYLLIKRLDLIFLWAFVLLKAITWLCQSLIMSWHFILIHERDDTMWICLENGLVATDFHWCLICISAVPQISCSSCSTESCKHLCFVWWKAGGGCRGEWRHFQNSMHIQNNRGLEKSHLHMNKLLTYGECLMPTVYGWTLWWVMCLADEHVQK